MRILDIFHFARQAATGTPLRTALMVLSMSIGVAAVVALTALGEGARRYVVGEFGSLGSNLVIVLPGRTATGGIGFGNAITTTQRDLTLEDALALKRLPTVLRTAPVVVGNSELAYNSRLREVLIVGSTHDYQPMRKVTMAQGQFLPVSDDAHGAAVAVIGAKIYNEIFGGQSALGEVIRLGSWRLRVIGVLSPSGQGLGMSTDELVIVPAATAQAMFNTHSMFRLMIEARDHEQLQATKIAATEMLKVRHGGEEDVTLVTQDAVLSTFNRILSALTLGVAGIAAISLAVAGILVMNVMLVSVSQRTAEIGLLKALGATAHHIRITFLAEAALLSSLGALLGLGLGYIVAWAIRTVMPSLPAFPPLWASVAGVTTALITGLLFGVLPAQKAAKLDPISALTKQN